MSGPDTEDFLVIDDTWRGISAHIIDGMEPATGFESVADAVEWCLDEMDRTRFWSDIYIQHDRGDPYLYQRGEA